MLEVKGVVGTRAREVKRWWESRGVGGGGQRMVGGQGDARWWGSRRWEVVGVKGWGGGVKG